MVRRRVLAAGAVLVVAAGCSDGRALEPVQPAASLARPAEYRFPIYDCRASYGRTHHDYPASDVFAKTGCAVVSVTAGVVDEVSRRDRWSPGKNDGATRGGLSVSIVGDDGVRYYYSHLSKIAARITPGERVEPGQRLGRVGTTGSARGTSPHLHFGLSWPTPHHAWWIRRGMVAPAPYLDAWRDGRDRSPAPKVERLRAAKGDLPPCASAC